MRRPASYPEPRYTDPRDLRLVRIIKDSETPKANAVNILGVPYDGAVLGRKGAAEGPSALREALIGFSNYNAELGIGLKHSRIFDLGDIAVGQRDLRATHALIKEEVSAALREGSLLAILGGDNSLSLPALKAYAEKFGDIGLVVIDSHLDLRGEIGGKPTSGSSYGLAIETIGGLGGSKVVEIGSHGFLNSEDYFDKAKEMGVSIFSAADVRKLGSAAVASKALAKASKGSKAVYLSVDLDSVDVGWVTGASAPSSGGIDPWNLFDLVYELTKSPSVGCADIVELAPSLDPTGRSQAVAASALTYMFAGFASRKSKKG